MAVGIQARGMRVAEALAQKFLPFSPSYRTVHPDKSLLTLCDASDKNHCVYQLLLK